MRKNYCIYLGGSGIVLIYMSGEDKLYRAYEKADEYKSISYISQRLLMSLFIVSVLLLYKHTFVLRFVFSLNVFQCLILTLIISLSYKYIISRKKISSLLDENIEQIDIRYDIALWNSVFTMTIDTITALTFTTVTSIIGWLSIDDIMIQNEEWCIIAKFSLFILFCFTGYLSGRLDLIGKIKLLRRLRKEKQ